MLKRTRIASLLAGLTLSLSAQADREAEAARFYEDALTRYGRGDDASAIIQLKNALKEDPKMLPALVLLGQAHLRRGNPRRPSVYWQTRNASVRHARKSPSFRRVPISIRARYACCWNASVPMAWRRRRDWRCWFCARARRFS